MRVIFLDIDGVLNTTHTRERIPGLGFIGIDPKLVENLKLLVDQSNKVDETMIVLSSSWRAGVDRFGNAIPGHYSYLRECLAEQGLVLFDETPFVDSGRKRGTEIRKWLAEHKDLPIKGIVILDDEFWPDFKGLKVSRFLVRTSYWGARGGLQEGNVREALKKLQMEIPGEFWG